MEPGPPMFPLCMPDAIDYEGSLSFKAASYSLSAPLPPPFILVIT